MMDKDNQELERKKEDIKKEVKQEIYGKLGIKDE